MLPAERRPHVREPGRLRRDGDDDGVQVHQYASARCARPSPTGGAVAFDVETGYPAEGGIRVSIVGDTPGEWTLAPARARVGATGARLRVTTADGVEERDAAPGVCDITRAFRAGDVVELDLPIAPRVTWPDPHIDAVRGCVAIERGPEVLALESTDLAALGVDDVGQVVIDPAAPLLESDGRVSAGSGCAPRRRPSGPTALPMRRPRATAS